MTTITVASPQYLNLNVSDGSSDVNLAVTLPSEINLAVDVGQGPSGPQGIQGNSITNIARTSGTGAAGTTDTYTIYYSDNTTDTFQLYNGQNGNYIYEGVPVVQQTDIGTEPNEIPLNQYLGSMAYQNKEAVSLDSLTVPTATANSVAYFNDSKALTTGSALTFDGSKVNTTKYYIAQGPLTAFDAPSGGLYSYYSSGGNIGAYADNSGTLAPLISAGSYHVWGTGTEQMRLTSTGLGIGTSSPGATLHVNSTQYINSTTSATIPALSTGLVDGEIHAGINNAIAGDSGLLRLSAGGGTTLGVKTAIDIARGSTDASQIRAYTSGTERLRIDSSGNLGLGVVPSGWDSGGPRALQITASAAIRGNGTNATQYFCNASYDGAFKYIGSYAASYYQQTSGVHAWYTAPSGTAGNAISFTQALTLNADGKLLIGTTTAGASKLTVNDDSIQINTAKTPASATDTGTTGQVAWDANYIYVCVATNTWKRSALSTW